MRFESLESRQMMAADSLALDSSQYDTTRLLAQFRTPAQTSALIGTTIAGAKVTRQITSDGWFELSIVEGNVPTALKNLQSRTDVLAATPDFRIYLDATPNDSSYASQWALENNGVGGVVDADIDAAQAWNYGTSSSVVVAVIDTGIDYNHFDLAQNIWINSREIAGNGVDDDRNGYTDDVRGWNFVSRNNNPMDDNGHGTHVAGTIGAVGNNGAGVSGIVWNIKMMALKFLAADGSGALSDAVAAIDYARTNGAKIINASWGGGDFSSALQLAIQRFQNGGGIFVAAAGNEAANNAALASYPANYPLSNVISVAASTQSDTLASFSNYGTNVDIAAPGNQILSTIPGNRFSRYSGTSMAAPHVAGAFALLWGQSPSLTAAQLIDAVMKNTDSVLKGPTIYGRLNVGKAAAALNGAAQSDTAGAYLLSASWNATAVSVASVDVTFSEAMRLGTLQLAASIAGPDGPVPFTSIVATNATQTVFRISFATQTKLGIYQLVIQSTAADTAGNMLDQDRDGVSGETIQDRYISSFTIHPVRSYTTTGPITLPDATRTRAAVTTIAINVPDSIVISDLNVNLSVDHTYVSDLRVRLIGPDGTSVQLVNRRGGFLDNIRVLFDDKARTSISAATGNLSGTFLPEQTLAAFDGKVATGRWTLEVIDLANQDVGRLNSVSLQITGTVSASSTSTSAPASADSASVISAALFEWLQRQLRRIYG
jgi:serine protease